MASKPDEFNSYGARRGNHEVMVRGTFANIRLRNQLAPGTEGGWTLYLPGGEKMSIYDAAVQYREEGVAAGGDRGQGIWLRLVARLGRERHAAAGRARSDRGELRAHPPQQPDRDGRAAAGVQGRENRESLGLTGHEIFSFEGVASLAPGRAITVRAKLPDGREKQFTATARVDTPEEVSYYQHGGILQYVLRQML